MTELTAGDAQVLAYVGSGETETWLVQASAVNQSPEGRDCPAASCAESTANSGSFSVSGAYDAAARAIGSSDTGSTVAQATQSGSDQKDSSQPPAGGTEQGTIDPAAPDGDSTASGEEFSGSPEPAGPDLTVSEEQSAISQGWK